MRYGDMYQSIWSIYPGMISDEPIFQLFQLFQLGVIMAKLPFVDYITIYILNIYIYINIKRGNCHPLKSNWNNWNWNILLDQFPS